jgi:hypothetical protein
MKTLERPLSARLKSPHRIAATHATLYSPNAPRQLIESGGNCWSDWGRLQAENKMHHYCFISRIFDQTITRVLFDVH